MPIRDLVVSEKEVSEEQLDRILRGRVVLAKDTRRAMLTPEGSRLPARKRTLVALASCHAWRFIETEREADINMTTKEIEGMTGLPGNTVRPVLKGLKDDHLIESPRQGVFRLPPHSLNHVLEELEDEPKQKKRR